MRLASDQCGYDVPTVSQSEEFLFLGVILPAPFDDKGRARTNLKQASVEQAAP